jgi:hypothetical protein
MPIHFFITKVVPVLAILAIYWVGSFNLPNIIFLPIAAITLFLVVVITKRYGDKVQPQEKDDNKKDSKTD